jgi:hypothetical protein
MTSHLLNAVLFIPEKKIDKFTSYHGVCRGTQLPPHLPPSYPLSPPPRQVLTSSPTGTGVTRRDQVLGLEGGGTKPLTFSKVSLVAFLLFLFFFIRKLSNSGALRFWCLYYDHEKSWNNGTPVMRPTNEYMSTFNLNSLSSFLWFSKHKHYMSS